MSDVETINGFAVGFSFLRFYKLHPEIGNPIAEQQGDVGGYQSFDNANLIWTGEKVVCQWYDSSKIPEWMEGETRKEFEV
jgi:hypothetical protein